ncbi:MAG: hypothetical protein JWL84_3050 [Rhodospirillales bacterium]|jgi:hypothetical protein|nr:hypothetical protein [Rhodospirillales bacterium]
MDNDAKFRTVARLLIERLGADAPGAAAEHAVASLREGDEATALVWIEIVKLALIATGASPLLLRRSLAETLRREATRLVVSAAEARELDQLVAAAQAVLHDDG